MADKPRGKAPQPPARREDAGRLGTNDRGDVTWEWKKDDPDLVADDELGIAERVSALVDPDLDVTEEGDDTMNPLQNNPRGLKSGYNPYNSGALGKQSWKKKKDLRKLSGWIELRKKMSGRKSEE